MILYVDTSALVPLLIREPASSACGDLWDAAERLVTVRLTFVEATAALAMAQRLDRITADQHAAVGNELTILWEHFDVIEFDRQLMIDAARAAASHRLRGYDAVHFAAALAIDDENVVAAAGDARLLEAWRAGGLATTDVTQPD